MTILSDESICRPSAGPRGSPGSNRVPPIDPFKQIAELSRADRHRASRRRRPLKPTPLQALGVERRAETVTPENLDKVAFASAEYRRDRPHADPARDLVGPAAPACSSRAACPSRRSRSRPAPRSAPGSSPLQNPEHPRQRRRVHIPVNRHTRAVRQGNLDTAGGAMARYPSAPADASPAPPLPSTGQPPGRSRPPHAPAPDTGAANRRPGSRSRHADAPQPTPKHRADNSPPRSGASAPRSTDGDGGEP